MDYGRKAKAHELLKNARAHLDESVLEPQDRATSKTAAAVNSVIVAIEHLLLPEFEGKD